MTSKSGPKAIMNEIANNKIFTEETITNYMSKGMEERNIIKRRLQNVFEYKIRI